MIRSLKFQLLTNLRNLGVLFLILFLFIPYTWLLVGRGEHIGTADYYLGMCLGVLLVMSFLLPFTNAATLVRLALGYGATRRGWFWAGIASKIIVQLLACAMVLFVNVPVGTIVFGGAAAVPQVISQALYWVPLLLAGTLALSSAAEAAGYVMSRYSGKVLILVIIVGVGVVVVIVGMLIAFAGVERVLSTISIPIVTAVCLAVCVLFQIVCWRLVRNLAAA